MHNHTLPEGFVLVGEAIPDALLDIRYYTTYNFVGARIDGYEAPVAVLTREAADALKLVSDDMKAQGLRLVIYDAYRPQRAVDHFARWAEDIADTRMKSVFYPDVDKADLFEKGFIARRSGHSRGSTVDLTLLDEATGKLLDMGGPFDFFGELSHPDYAGVTPAQHANRMLLHSAMMKRGFRPLSTEWWHFTLVDEPYPKTFFDFPVRG
jgi:D-alanyl-D-alanine dipeptidase